MGGAFPFTSADLDLFPDAGKRYEIIDGELYVSDPTRLHHQYVCGELLVALDEWNRYANSGKVILAPGVIFTQYDDVAPDVVLGQPRQACSHTRR